MANTLKIYADSGLVTEQSSAISIIQNSDGTTGPVDTQLWLGSVAASTQFQAFSNPGIDQIQLMPKSTYNEWAPNTSYTVNTSYVRPLAVKNGYLYRALTTGLSGASEPTWPTTVGNQVVDNQVTWICQELIHEVSEMKLALTQGGLDAAVGGDPLNVGITLLSGSANAIEFWARIEDATHELSTETELYATTNTTQETPQ